MQMDLEMKHYECKLITDLLITLGYSIKSDTGLIYTQESGRPVLFDGKNIKAVKQPDKSIYISPNDIKLEPLNPKCNRLMKKLMLYYLELSADEGELADMVVYSLNSRKDGEEELYSLEVKFKDGSVICTKEYKHSILCYSDIILNLDGSYGNVDLSYFDTKLE